MSEIKLARKFEWVVKFSPRVGEKIAAIHVD